MKNQKTKMLEPQIAAQNAETPRNPNMSGEKISGSKMNPNTSGDHGNGGYRKNPNTSQIK